MVRKVYKEGYQIIVEPPISEELEFTSATWCSFGFDKDPNDNDVVWVRSDVSGRYIYNGLVSDMLDSAGNPIGSKEWVEEYLLGIIGDGTKSSTPTTGNILFSDTFDGTIIDVNKWTKYDPSSKAVQDDELTVTMTGVSNETQWLRYLRGQSAIDIADIKVLSFDIDVDDQDQSTWGVFVSADETPSDYSNLIGVRRIGTAGSVFIVSRASDVNISTETVALDISTTKTMKVIIDSGNVSFYYWSGSSWTSLGASTTTTLTGSVYPTILFSDTVGQPIVMNIDNYSVTNIDFSTQYPI